jgi:hypothetical protein
MSTFNSQMNGPEGTIPVTEAIDLAANWRTYLGNSKQDFKARAFTVPIIDFTNIIKYNPDADGVRIYIGLESATDPATAELVLVPTVNGLDVPYLPYDANGKTVSVEAEGQSNTYNFSKTCPPVCTVSILNP